MCWQEYLKTKGNCIISDRNIAISIRNYLEMINLIRNAISISALNLKECFVTQHDPECALQMYVERDIYTLCK